MQNGRLKADLTSVACLNKTGGTWFSARGSFAMPLRVLLRPVAGEQGRKASI
jgi:hypothetical protein